MKVALIGAGKNGAGHVRRLAAMDDVQVIAVADPVAENAAVIAAEVGAKTYGDHRAMLEAAKPDAVWISSPCWLHAQHTIDCAAAGAHVMCEKPMALNLEDCDRMIDAARTHGVKLMIGQSTRYSAALLELKRIFESGRCGGLVSAWSVRMSFSQHRPGTEWRFDDARSGGIVMEWEVHEIDFVRSIGGEVSRVYAQTACSGAHGANFLDNFSAVLTFERGGYGRLEASQSCTLGMGSRGFVGTTGTGVAQGDGVQLRTVDGEKPETIDTSADGYLTDALGRLPQDADFVRAIREDAPSPVPGEDARRNIEIGLAIVKSGKTGNVVSLG
ncbi:MAG: Gfo/Idh/MocA family oxidoreductase [Kiritimatiellae bacterium]|nr:Gfo/Idh/MocA family oxidoreductase [Kiritimatiellia bacterium]